MGDALPVVPAATDPSARLRATVLAFPGQRFAVVDGGHFEDVPGLFRRARLFARSLFLDHADAEVERAGPWLVGLDQSPGALDEVLRLVGDQPAAVFWSCLEGEAVLHRHLRTLNMARIPAWAADGGSEPPVDGSGQELKSVMFRHWDPTVLGALLPVLDTQQFSRVVGPAEEVAFRCDDFGGLKRVLKDSEWISVSTGLLIIRSEQVVALTGRRISACHKRIVNYLKAYASPQVGDQDDAELLANAKRYDSEARRFGVHTQREVFLWSFMQATSMINLAKEPSVVRFMADPAAGSTPEKRIQNLFDIRLQLLEGRG